MKPRRPSFALDYIEETVDCYIRCVNSNISGRFKDDIDWSHDVLEEYFSITEKSALRDRELKNSANTRQVQVPQKMLKRSLITVY